MKTRSLLLLALLAVSAAAYAQNAPLSGVAESTDPAKIADIERRAQDIESQRQSSAPMDEQKMHKKHPMHRHGHPGKKAMDAAPASRPDTPNS